MKHKNKHTNTSGKVKKSRAEKRAEKNAILSVHKRPIVCPPDKAGRHPLFRLGGLICRALVIWLSSSGLMIFLADAIQSGVSVKAVFLTSLIVVTLGMIFGHSGGGKLISSGLSVATLATLVALRPRLLTDLPYSFLSLYNATLTRLNKLGYWSYAKFRVDITRFTDTTDDLLSLEAICIITALITLLFVLCFSRKVHLVPPAILATSLLAVVLTFNIYSNNIRSNLGVALVIVSFASVLVMAAYDRLYSRTDKRQYDTELRLFDDSDRPTMPAEYIGRKEARAAHKKIRRAAKRNRNRVSADEEITDYFNPGKRKKKRSNTTDAEAAAHRAMMRRVREVKKYDRVTEESRAAMGGYAAAAVMLACLIAISLPAAVIKGNFSTIPAIDEKVELARDYVTALLRGDDKALDRLDYKTDGNNFKPRPTDAEQLSFTGRQMFLVQSRHYANLYMRGWLGVDYKDGAWRAVTDPVLNRYHELFGENANPAEEMKYDFFYYMMPELVGPEPGSDEVFPDYYLEKFRSNAEYGFAGTYVTLKKINSSSSLTYFPTSFDPNYGVLKPGTVEKYKLSYVNYFDGLYSGRAFDKNKLQYSTIAYAPIMTNSFWIENLSHLEASYSLQKEALLVMNGITTSDSRITMEMTQSDTHVGFHYTHKSGRKNVPDIKWSTYHQKSSFTRTVSNETGYTTLTVRTADGTLILTLDGKTVRNATVTESATGVNLLDAYMQNMTDAERSALMDTLTRDRDYSGFVYDTYTGTSGSEAIRELALTIREQAHIEVRSDGAYTNVPADVSLADKRNPSIADAYIQRDRLVRNVIDYIISELGCTYTITPDTSAADPALDGVENFLFNTKEGYCVQFASSVALILRELGIPTRYVEGYIASGMSYSAREDIYSGIVLDEDAHAWVEVWYDGVGWIQYEATPEYYRTMYGLTGAIDTNPGTPGETQPKPPSDTETEPPIETSGDGETDTDTETESENESETEITVVGGGNDRGLYTALIGLGVLAILAGLALLLRTVSTRARRAEEERQDAVTRALEPDLAAKTTDEERRAMASDITGAVMDLLSYMELSPKPGEFREEYAERLTATLTAPVKGQKARRADAVSDTKVSHLDGMDADLIEARQKAERERPKATLPDDTPLPNLHIALEGMAAEEFGHGMSAAELREVAALYTCLHGQIKRRIPLSKRLKLRYGKRKI